MFLNDDFRYRACGLNKGSDCIAIAFFHKFMVSKDKISSFSHIEKINFCPIHLIRRRDFEK